MLFAEIEAEVKEKSKFIKSQVAGVDNMIINFRNLIARINVLKNALSLLRVGE